MSGFHAIRITLLFGATWTKIIKFFWNGLQKFFLQAKKLLIMSNYPLSTVDKG